MVSKAYKMMYLRTEKEFVINTGKKKKTLKGHPAILTAYRILGYFTKT